MFPPLEENSGCRLGRTAAPHELGSVVEVDLHVRGEDERRLDVVPGSGELVETPAKDHLCFGLIDRLELGRSHRSPFVDGAVELQVASSGAFWASLEVQTARAKGLVPPRERPSDEGRNPRPSAPECRHRAPLDPSTRGMRPTSRKLRDARRRPLRGASLHSAPRSPSLRAGSVRCGRARPALRGPSCPSARRRTGVVRPR